MREVYRQNKQILSTPLQEHNIQLSFMVIYVAKDMVPYNEMEARMKKILVRLADKAAKRVEF